MFKRFAFFTTIASAIMTARANDSTAIEEALNRGHAINVGDVVINRKTGEAGIVTNIHHDFNDDDTYVYVERETFAVASIVKMFITFRQQVALEAEGEALPTEIKTLDAFAHMASWPIEDVLPVAIAIGGA